MPVLNFKNYFLFAQWHFNIDNKKYIKVECVIN